MAARGIDVRLLRITRKVKEEIIRTCSHPETLREIIRRAEALVFMPKEERALAASSFAFFCSEQPCVIYQPPEGVAHITLEVTRRREPVIISIARVVWTMTHCVSEQGEALLGSEELVHSCSRNGDGNTGTGCCLNPFHMIVATPEDRQKLRNARQRVREVLAS